MLCLTVSFLALMGLEFYGNFPLSLPPWEFVSFSFISGEPSSLKVAKTRCDLEATESQLSAAVENLKGIKEETDKYKREVGALQDQLREAELTFKHKIAAHERSALDNWVSVFFFLLFVWGTVRHS